PEGLEEAEGDVLGKRNERVAEEDHLIDPPENPGPEQDQAGDRTRQAAPALDPGHGRHVRFRKAARHARHHQNPPPDAARDDRHAEEEEPLLKRAEQCDHSAATVNRKSPLITCPSSAMQRHWITYVPGARPDSISTKSCFGSVGSAAGGLLRTRDRLDVTIRTDAPRRSGAPEKKRRISLTSPDTVVPSS